ncbi:uncharacterized protein LOC113850717 [Abrus precatorius]|uniref:Uncharacterized protein LOC113850717 n=1 Tax=Abrus precatorius TaxID=3816 RepID=A0A8B8K0T4_ABRPR|nr:uncharacterized protein LOC113850717 [Abrus precatorius]
MRARISQDHSKLNADTIAECIKPMVESNPSFKIKLVINEVQAQFRYTTTYRKAWMANQKAIEKVYAYRKYELVPDVQILHRIFWSFPPCIRAFRHCKPLVQVDGTHLYGKYKGALLVVVAQDGNQNILPIGFAIVEGETADGWHFFLENLLKHVVTQDGVGIIFDRHESINAAIRRSNGQWEPPKASHMYCIRHIGANFLRRFKTPYLHKLVIRMGYSRTESEFNIHFERLRQRGEVHTDWLNEIPREKWVLVYDGGHRWDHMTTTLVEFINSVLKGARNLPITALVRATYFLLAKLFARKGCEAYAQKKAGHIFSEAVTTRLQSNEQASRNLFVAVFDRRNETFLVQDNIDWRCYVEDVYKINELCKVYKKEFGVIGNESMWRIYRGLKLIPNPNLKRIIRGRPKSTLFLNEMDRREMRRTQCCTLCRSESHSRRICPNAPRSSSQG